MSKPILSLLSLMILCVCSVQAQLHNYLLHVEEFSEFTVADNINVIYKCNPDSAGYAVYTSDKTVSRALTFSNNKGKLKIQVISETPITEPLPTVIIYSAALGKVTNLGDSTIYVLSTHPCDKLGLKVMGNGTIKAMDVYTTKLSATVEAGSGHIYVSGKSQEANYNVAGAGVIEGGALSSVKVKAWMLGTGSIDCSVDKTLAVYGAGSGTVYFKGDPVIKRRNLGVKLVQMSSK